MLEVVDTPIMSIKVSTKSISTTLELKNPRIRHLDKNPSIWFSISPVSRGLVI